MGRPAEAPHVLDCSVPAAAYLLDLGAVQPPEHPAVEIGGEELDSAEHLGGGAEAVAVQDLKALPNVASFIFASMVIVPSSWNS